MDEVEDDEREGAFVFQATRRELPADVRLQSVGNFVFLVHASMGQQYLYIRTTNEVNLQVISRYLAFPSTTLKKTT